MWDQVRVDHGTKFCLTLYMQERNAANWLNTSRQPYIQSQWKRVRVDHVLAGNILIVNLITQRLVQIKYFFKIKQFFINIHDCMFNVRIGFITILVSMPLLKSICIQVGHSYI